MSNPILSEKQYQQFIIDYLHENNGYIVHTDADYNRAYSFDNSLLISFLYATQKKTMQELEKIYKDNTIPNILAAINAAITASNSSLISCLKHGVEIENRHLDLMYTKPATDFNKDESSRYDLNMLSVIPETNVEDEKKERVDLVIFLNGIAIIAIELKCNAAGQNVGHAKNQFRHTRDSSKRLFMYKSGVLVNFGMDLYSVVMTTKIAGEETRFLPFDMGRMETITLPNGETYEETGKGNPIYDDGRLPVSYMWEDILTKDTIIELIGKFIFLERKETLDALTGKTKHKETLIFPRYHQLRLLRKLVADVSDNGSSRNYLIQHSAGSGKTNSITWLAHRLSSLHDANQRQIFNTIIIVTDRKVVDSQLQVAVRQIDHKAGLIKVLDDTFTSEELKKAIEGNNKIIATTIQKFPYICDSVSKFADRRFAVIIDEAHSSTSGANMKSLLNSLNTAERSEDDDDAMTVVEKQLSGTGKAANVSMFAFTATPKHSTLQMFGTLNEHGKKEAFDLYSMKQAIEEGFIIDVLDNYTTYKTHWETTKLVKDDPLFDTKAAKKEIVRMALVEKPNIEQKTAFIVEHFRSNVMTSLEGKAKAMVVTSSRKEAVLYKKQFDAYIKAHGYADIKTLVAFTGKVKLDDDETEYSEVGMNNAGSKKHDITEDNLRDVFDREEYKFLLVANKYQTGFDQQYLCAMYVLKKLKGIAAVQTLSRLNRKCEPYDKVTRIVDFANDYKDIRSSFAPYYSRTILENPVKLEDLLQVQDEILAYGVLDEDEIEETIKLVLEKKNQSGKVASILLKVQRRIEDFNEESQRDIAVKMRRYVKWYQYLSQIVPLNDTEKHKFYLFLSYLLPFLHRATSNKGFDLKNKIRFDRFNIYSRQQFGGDKIKDRPTIKTPDINAPLPEEPEKEKLSKIVMDINARYGLDLEAENTAGNIEVIKAGLEHSSILKKSARHNDVASFTNAFYEQLDNVLVDSNEKTEKLYNFLLNTEDAKKELFGFIIDGLWKKLRGEG